MPRGYRLPIIAVAGWLALTGWAEGHGGGKGAYYKQQAAAAQGTEPAQSSTPFNNPPDAVSVQPPCENPITQNQRDLCQQWRMAEAADQLVNVSWLQVALTAASLVGLGLTIWFTYKAADAAGTAASAAVDSNKVARELGETQARAYLAVTRGVVRFGGTDLKPTAKFWVNNSGDTPAKNVRAIYKVERIRRNGNPPITEGNNLRVSEYRLAHHIGAKTEDSFEFLIPEAPVERDSANPDGISFRLDGLIEYQSVFGEKRGEIIRDCFYTFIVAELITNILQRMRTKDRWHHITLFGQVVPPWLPQYLAAFSSDRTKSDKKAAKNRS